MRLPLLAVAALGGCDPYAAWPDPTTVFPWVYTPEADLPDYALVRVETETWRPFEDLEETVRYVEKATFHKPSAPYEELLHFGELRPRIPPPDPADTTVTFCGDVMRFGDDFAHFADGVADRFVGLRVGNLETPVSRHHSTDLDDIRAEYGANAVNAPLELLDGLPLDVVQINNNHSLDVGDDGLEQTYRDLVRRGFTPIGMDDNAAFAGRGGATIALLSYTWGVNVLEPSAHDLWIVPFGHMDEPVDLERVGAEIAAARRAGATHVALLLHWGFEYEYYPDPHFLQLGRELVALGADLIVGTGPHAVEPAEICDVNRPRSRPDIGRCSVRDLTDPRPRTAAILYSLGDFGTELETIPLQVGILATVSLRPGVGVTGLGWQAVASVPTPSFGQELVPLVDLLDDPEYAAEQARLDMLLGTTWRTR